MARGTDPVQAIQGVEKPLRISFVSTAYNEESNLQALYERCLAAFEQHSHRQPGRSLEFEMVLVDNSSIDATPQRIADLMARDARVHGYRNVRNYGPEPSFMYGMSQASGDLIVLLCADLQDPPDVAGEMISRCLAEPDRWDAVLGCKEKSAGSSLIQTCRKLYYRLLSFSDRDSTVLPGFHGFGCYTQPVVRQALWLWENSRMNMRTCFSLAADHPHVIHYQQPDRLNGRSSYSFRGYAEEASAAIMSGKSMASRISLRIGVLAFIASLVIGLFVLLNTASGRSGYAGGIPTLAMIVLLSSAVQVILLSLVSRQIEASLNLPLRLKVRSRQISSCGEPEAVGSAITR